MPWICLLTLVLVVQASGVAGAPAGLRAQSADSPSATAVAERFAGKLEFDGQSDYSHIRVRKRGSVRSMLFVRDGGEEVLESQIDLRRPHELRFPYLRSMFASYLLRDQQPDVLIVGLGGGGMIHFLHKFAPQTRIDAVEIDPLVVQLADEYFGVRSEGNVAVITVDGFKFIADCKKKYDVIYMDAFLKPSAETDATGVPLSLRTRRFYEQLQAALKPDGLVVFNLNPHANIDQDRASLRDAFAQVYDFSLGRSHGSVVVASNAPARVPADVIVGRAKELDRRAKGMLQFQTLARQLQP